jgi:hypothetical protein
MKNGRVNLLLATLGAVLVLVGSALAQGQPQPPQPPPQPKQPQQPQGKDVGRKLLRKYYMEGEEELKSFTYKENPPFKIYKPSDKWHFVDVAKFHGDQARAVQNDQERRKKIDSFFKICKFIMYNEEINAEARVLVGVGYGKKTLEQLMMDIENSLKQGYADYKRLSLKGKKKSKASGACLTFEGTPQNQKKDKCVWYLFLREDNFYQLRIHAEEETFKDNEKEFKKIYDKWKF